MSWLIYQVKLDPPYENWPKKGVCLFCKETDPEIATIGGIINEDVDDEVKLPIT